MLFAILAASPLVLRCVFFIVIIVILLRYRQDYRRPANYALAGIVINLVISCGHLLFQVVLVRYVPQQNYPVVITGLSLFSALGGVVVLSLLLIAVFIDRDPLGGVGSREGDLGGMPVAGQPSQNPYVAPPQRRLDR
ncbi:MAG: hypothetical protein P1U77_10385 [Rubripirellula sp.]|nr:hypothetical protein [Rubripirellula sp.]